MVLFPSLCAPPQPEHKVYLILLHRGAQSLAPLRATLGSSAFHLGIFICAPPSSAAGTISKFFSAVTSAFTTTLDVASTPGTYIDVANSLQPKQEDPTFVNQAADWYFRCESLIPSQDPRVLALVQLGNLRSGVTIEEVRGTLQALAVPERDQNEKNCVSWALEGVAELQKVEWIDRFDVTECETFTRAKGIDCVEKLESKAGELKLPTVTKFIAL